MWEVTQKRNYEKEIKQERKKNQSKKERKTQMNKENKGRKTTSKNGRNKRKIMQTSRKEREHETYQEKNKP